MRSQPINRREAFGLALLAGALVALAVSAPAAHAIYFSPPSHIPVGSEPQEVLVDSFNADAYPDLVVVNEAQHSTSAGSVMVFLGSAGGSFTSSANISFSGRRPTEVAVDDFNGDSKSDLAVANFATDSVSVLLGNGNGTFGAPTNIPVVPHGSPVSIQTGDLDGDSKADLVVANEGSSYSYTETDPAICSPQPAPCNISTSEPTTVSVLLGAGNGNFTVLPKLAGFPASSSLQSIAIGQFSSDSNPDLALANKTLNRVSVLFGAGNGTFGGLTEYAAGAETSAVAVGQLNSNADSRPDIVVANELSHNVAVLLGGSGGSFSSASFFAAPSPVSSPVSVSLGKLNADSFSDVVVANIGTDNVSVFVGGPGGGLTGANFAAGDGPTSAAVGDFNADTYPDIAVTNEISNNVSILLATPPDTTIGSSPPPLTNDLSPSFSFSSNQLGSTFQCKLSGPGVGSGSFSSCTSPKSYNIPDAPSSNGTYTFQVYAIDDAGRIDSSPASASFTLDIVPPPTPTLTDSEPASPANDNHPLIRGTAAAGSTVTLYTTADCTGSPAATGPAASFNGSGIAVSVLDNTTTEFYATASDAAGNVSGCSTSSVTYVEETPPPPPDPDPDPVPPPGGGGPPGPAGPPDPGAPIKVDVTAPSMTVAGKTLKLKSGAVSLALSCPASEPGGCAGSVAIETVVQARAGKRKVKLGKAQFRIAGGKNGAVKLRLSKRNRALVKRLRKVRVIALINARDQVGNTKTTTVALTLKNG